MNYCLYQTGTEEKENTMEEFYTSKTQEMCHFCNHASDNGICTDELTTGYKKKLPLWRTFIPRLTGMRT
jgi:hypothetical protein